MKNGLHLVDQVKAATRLELSMTNAITTDDVMKILESIASAATPNDRDILGVRASITIGTGKLVVNVSGIDPDEYQAQGSIHDRIYVWKSEVSGTAYASFAGRPGEALQALAADAAHFLATETPVPV